MLLFAQLFDGWVFESPSNFSCLQIKSEFLSSASHYWSQKQNLVLWNLHYNECIINFFFFSVMEKIDVLEIIWLSSLWKMSVNKRKKKKLQSLWASILLHVGTNRTVFFERKQGHGKFYQNKMIFCQRQANVPVARIGTHPEWHRNLLLILL